MVLSELPPGKILHSALQQRWLIWSVNALLVLWLAWLIGAAVLDFLTPPKEPVATQPPMAPRGDRPQISTGQMAGWHLFGMAVEAAASQKATVIDAPETKLKLTLRGIVAENDKHAGYAIIQNPQKMEQHFAVNDSIFGLATLVEIYVDRVIILRKKEYETLTLPKESLNLGYKNTDATRKKRGKLIDDYRKAILSGDIEKFVGVVDVEELHNEGGFYGFQLLAESERGKHLLSELGLEHEDIVIEIDGKVLAEDLEAVSNVGKLKTATDVSVVIDRNGAKIPYHIKLPQDQ